MSMLRFFPESWLCARAVFNEIDGEPMNRCASELHRRDVSRKASPSHQADMAAAREVLNRAVVPPADSATLTQLIAMFRQREQVGLAKYGTTVDRTDLVHQEWLRHALEESMDMTIYLLRAALTATEE
ncbi:hypothetical protein P3W24_04090 [Luteibacter sp. PPL201]|jgi:hypothetical protein|uniref:Uncharacterized protein n=1 Tax=Luteibacter sahnii TaxID=3021977 RepID=A0ABT6B7T8_9GAMM|nr:hypothetical protein [Luteibacter sp. PPL193]MDY1547948.1 hypothetical protein [Luteibacter sp. PPL193]